MSEFRKKPVVIKAWQYPAERNGVCNCVRNPDDHLHTAHAGQLVVLSDGDWIIPESDGEHFYPCKPDVFAVTYEPAGTPTPDVVLVPKEPTEEAVWAVCNTGCIIGRENEAGACLRCPATEETPHGTGMRMCRSMADSVARAAMLLASPSVRHAK